MKYKELKCSTYCMCTHCGEKYCGNASGGCALFCSNCRTADARKDMCNENRKLIKDYVCKMCNIKGSTNPVVE